MSTSIKEAVEILKQKAREDAVLFFDEFQEELDPSTTDWDSVAFNITYSSLASETKDALENCSDFRPFIPVDEALERGPFSDRGWEVYQTELVSETARLASL